jgi:hypothetical protein
MTEGVQTSSSNGTVVVADGVSGHLVDAVLHGGPADLPQATRAQRVRREDTKVKIPHYGGHEHFERDGGTLAGCTEVVFRWIGRTRVAE